MKTNTAGNEKNNFIWNMLGSISTSALAFVLLIVVNRIMGEAAGGIFTLAFSHAQLMYYIGTLEVRPLHSTDVKEKHPFSAYFSLRAVSCAVMVLASLGYVLIMDGDPFKKRVMMYICLYKTFEAMEDVFTSMFQQHERIAYSGQLATLRVALSLAGFTGTLLLTHNLEAACIVMVLCGALTLVTFNRTLWKRFEHVDLRFHLDAAPEILKACFPLFISVFVMLYISNAPKYAINRYCTDVIQNRYSILFMPAFVINLFCQFMLRPLLTRMAKIWNDRKIKQFRDQVLKLTGIILLITAAGIAGAWLLGIPILQALYNLDLQADKSILLWVMAYGGLNAINVFLFDMIAVTRRQKWLLAGYVLAAIVIALISPVMVQRGAMTGAILSSIIAILILDLVLTAVLYLVIHRNMNKPEGGLST